MPFAWPRLSMAKAEPAHSLAQGPSDLPFPPCPHRPPPPAALSLSERARARARSPPKGPKGMHAWRAHAAAPLLSVRVECQARRGAWLLRGGVGVCAGAGVAWGDIRHRGNKRDQARRAHTRAHAKGHGTASERRGKAGGTRPRDAGGAQRINEHAQAPERGCPGSQKRGCA